MSAIRHLVFTIAVLAVVAVVGGCAAQTESASRATPSRALSGPSAGAGSAGIGEQSRYRPPVSAPVVDAFRPPPAPFGAGNRGIEYDTTSGTPVGAIGRGRVVFAGSVAGTMHVTVLHRDGLRSSYSYLRSTTVAVDDAVAAGQEVGRSGHHLHLGVRAGTAYLDPALLFGGDGVHLVPSPGPERPIAAGDSSGKQFLGDECDGHHPLES